MSESQQEPEICDVINAKRYWQGDRIRRGSRINTDRFPKRAPKAQASRGVRRRPPPGNFLDFYSLKSPFLGFIVIQKGYWPDSNLESVFIIKNIFVMKDVTDFRKTETGVDPRLRISLPLSNFCRVGTKCNLTIFCCYI